MVDKLRNILFFSVIVVSFFGCASLQKRAEKFQEQQAKNENLELITTEIFENNSTYYVLKEKSHWKLTVAGKQTIKHWGKVGE